MTNYAALIPELLRIAQDAGEAIMQVYNGADQGLVFKADDSPLTEADRQANAIICAGLERISPDILIISEENKILDYDIRRKASTCWLVDPLDGTKEFVKRNGDFTVNIALVEQGQPIMGVVFAPAWDELYYAAKGQGAFQVIGDEHIRLQAASYSAQDSGLTIVCSRSHLNEATQAFLDTYRQPQLASRGSAFKFLLLAAGKAHVYPRLAPTMEWDTAAAHIILEEAGGTIINPETGKSLEYNKESLINPNFVARGKES